MKLTLFLRSLCLTVLLGLGSLLHAQQTTDVIYLKDGSMIRGTILESIAGSHLRIRTEEGEVRQYDLKEVARTKMNGKGVLSPAKNIGYAHSSSLGLMVGGGYMFEANPSFQTVNGIHFGGRWVVGIGTGLESVRGIPLLPLFAEGRFHPLKGAVSPFVSAQGGYGISLDEGDDNYYYDFYPTSGNTSRGGPMAGGEVGVRFLGASRLGFTIAAGYRYQQVRRDYIEYIWTGSDYFTYPVQQITHANRFTLRLGLVFN